MKRPFPAKKLLVTFLVLIGLLVAADFGAAAVAEYQVSQKMRKELGLARAPAVRIHGFPFLTQALRGNFRHVEIKAKGVSVGAFEELGVQADLYNAEVSTAKVLAGTVDEINVAKVVGRIRLKASDIGRIIGVPDLSIAPAPEGALKEGPSRNGQSSGGTDGDSGSDGDNTSHGDGGNTSQGDGDNGSQGDEKPKREVIKLDGTINIAGTDNHVVVIAILSLVDGKLRISPRELKLDNSEFGKIQLPEIFERSMLRTFETTLDPGKLPFKVTPTAIRVERGAVIVEGTARNLTISASAMSFG